VTLATVGAVSTANANGAILNNRGRRTTFLKAVASRISVDYFLPGVTASISTPPDIPLDTRFRVLDSQGQETTTLGTNTQPTLTEYLAIVTNGGEIVAEDSQLERYRGNIYERRTRYIRAQ